MAGVKAKETAFKLPKYLRLNRGSMWFDTEGSNSSGIKLYTLDTIFVGRGAYPSDNQLMDIKKKTGSIPEVPEVPKDKFSNQNFVDYGFVSADKDKLPWYVDTQSIPNEKLSRVILAFKHGILVEADPKNPPKALEPEVPVKEFKLNLKGERVFIGQNKEMYKKLQNMSFDDLRNFIISFPKNVDAKNNLIDLFHYEQKGYNRLERPRLEVLDLIRQKLKAFGPSMSAIRVNED